MKTSTDRDVGRNASDDHIRSALVVVGLDDHACPRFLHQHVDVHATLAYQLRRDVLPHRAQPDKNNIINSRTKFLRKYKGGFAAAG